MSKRYTVECIETGIPDTASEWQSTPFGDEVMGTGAWMHLRRSPLPGSYFSAARIAISVNGVVTRYDVRPCPTRTGVARMARKLLRAALEGAKP